MSRFAQHKLLFILKKKSRVFILSAVMLLIAGLFFIPLKGTLITQQKNMLSSGHFYRDLTAIKPFTSLVGFNWKFSKGSRLKQKTIKQPPLSLPAINL